MSGEAVVLLILSLSGYLATGLAAGGAVGRRIKRKRLAAGWSSKAAEDKARAWAWWTFAAWPFLAVSLGLFYAIGLIVVAIDKFLVPEG